MRLGLHVGSRGVRIGPPLPALLRGGPDLHGHDSDHRLYRAPRSGRLTDASHFGLPDRPDLRPGDLDLRHVEPGESAELLRLRRHLGSLARLCHGRRRGRGLSRLPRRAQARRPELRPHVPRPPEPQHRRQAAGWLRRLRRRLGHLGLLPRRRLTRARHRPLGGDRLHAGAHRRHGRGPLHQHPYGQAFPDTGWPRPAPTGRTWPDHDSPARPGA